MVIRPCSVVDRWLKTGLRAEDEEQEKYYRKCVDIKVFITPDGSEMSW